MSDWGASTPRALDSLLAFLARFRSLGQRFRYKGDSADPLTAQLPPRTYDVRLIEPFMLRIVDPVRALVERGYPPALETRLSLAITDDESLPENVGSYLLQIEGGRATVTERTGTQADVQCGIRGFAARYAGYLSARQLVTLGWIDGDPPALRAAESVFGTERPCLSEMF